MVVVAAVVAGLIAAVGVLAMWRAARAGRAGRANLLAAEHALLAQRDARGALRAADADFASMREDLHAFPFGVALSAWRLVPLVRVQVRAVDTFATIGGSLAGAGIKLDAAAVEIERPSGVAVPLSASLDRLRVAQVSLADGVKVLADSTARLKALAGVRLLGPIGSAYRDASRSVAKANTMATSAHQAVTALIAFTGGDGPRTYILLSQNPDELRPTGGYIGSYGVLSAAAGRVRVTRYDDSSNWVEAHPDAVVPAGQVGSPFRFYDPPIAQSFANVNALPDWPQVAALTQKLWQEGGEAPSAGVVSFTPRFLARILAVTGPVTVPSYNETITAGNVIARLDYYTHGEGKPPPGENRKEFLSPLGEAVMGRLLAAPSTEWRGLGAAVVKAFEARELLVWSQDDAVESALVQRGWSGGLPVTDGDFFSDAEFEYAAKNGRSLKRTFDHHVQLQSDGSAQVTTEVTVTDTAPPSRANNNVLTYYTLYAPAGSVVDADASDPPFSSEPAIAGHPAAGWFRTLPANSTVTFKVVWHVPALAKLRTDGTWQYSLDWLPIVDNTGDILHLEVTLPRHAAWQGVAPPSQATLDHEVKGTWVFRVDR